VKKSAKKQVLLTNDERRAHIQDVFGHRLLKAGKFLLPTTLSYNSLVTDSGLQDVLIQICRWLGVKPNGLTAIYSDTTPENDVDHMIIHIATSTRNNPFLVGSDLCMAVLSHAMSRHSSDTVDKDILELATIETGLGLWIVNGLAPKQSHFQNVYHVLSGDWQYSQGISLTTFQNAQYAHAVAEWAHINRIAPEEYLPHIRSSNRHLLPSHLVESGLPSLPEPSVIHARHHMSRMFWVKLFLIVTIVALITLGALYAWSLRNPAISAKQLEEEQSLQILKRSYKACVLKATGQRDTYDPNDLLLERQIEATQSRCESLRNEYNHALDQYHTIYIK
jgi:hypothetical protein